MQVKLSELVFEYRKQREMSLRDLAKEIGIDKSTLFRFERGLKIEGNPLAAIISWSLSVSNPRKARVAA